MGKNKIRICLAIPSLGVGGMERVMSEIAWDFSRRENVELHLIMFGRDRSVFYSVPDNMNIHKPDFKYVSRYRLLFTLRTIFYIRSEIKRIKPDVLLSFGNYWNSLVLLAVYGLGIPVFVSDRSKPDKDMGRFHNWLRLKLYPMSAGVIAQTNKALTIYSNMYTHDNMITIGNPIRKIQLNTKIKREKIIISVGRLINTKHYDRLINIFYEINNPDWKLYIVGGDSLNLKNSIKYKELIKSLNLQDRVVLTGEKKNVEEYLCRASIFAFTSSSEGFPNVIGEALSAGLPVVAYDCLAGPSDMIENGKNGFLVPVFDDELMKIKLIELMQNEHLREEMGKCAKLSINKFDKEIICQQFFDFVTKDIKK